MHFTCIRWYPCNCLFIWKKSCGTNLLFGYKAIDSEIHPCRRRADQQGWGQSFFVRVIATSKPSSTSNRSIRVDNSRVGGRRTTETYAAVAEWCAGGVIENASSCRKELKNNSLYIELYIMLCFMLYCVGQPYSNTITVIEILLSTTKPVANSVSWSFQTTPDAQNWIGCCTLYDLLTNSFSWAFSFQTTPQMLQIKVGVVLCTISVSRLKNIAT